MRMTVGQSGMLVGCCELVRCDIFVLPGDGEDVECVVGTARPCAVV